MEEVNGIGIGGWDYSTCYSHFTIFGKYGGMQLFAARLLTKWGIHFIQD